MIIGIDLGTTNSCAAWYDNGRVEMIELPGGGYILPSVVSYSETGEILVGKAALRKVAKTHDTDFVFQNVKRHIGQPYVDGEDHGFQVTRGPDDMRALKGPDGLLSPQQVSSEVLKVLKQAAERRLGKAVKGARLTVPAYFNNKQIAATMEAARLAGFKTVNIFSEPEAAALAFKIDKNDYSRSVVFDLGGGTFDVVLMEAGKGTINVVDKNGYDQLGGINFDGKIRDWVIERYAQESGPITSQTSIRKIERAAEDAKIALTEELTTQLEVYAASFNTQMKMMGDIAYDLSREQFEALCRPLTDKAIEITKRCLDDAGWDVREVQEVLLVGGMTRVPMVRQAVADLFGEKKLRDTESPDLAVAKGAAIKAAIDEGRYIGQSAVNDITGRPFGLEVEGGRLHVVLPAGVSHGELVSVNVSTAQDQQGIIPIAVLQGEAGSVEGADVLARYDHSVSPGHAGSHTIGLDFMVDENGLLMVSGTDQDTGEKFDILGAVE